MELSGLKLRYLREGTKSGLKRGESCEDIEDAFVKIAEKYDFPEDELNVALAEIRRVYKEHCH